MFHEPVQNSCVKFRASVYQLGQDEVWRRRTAELILWYYESHRPSNDCPMRVLVAVMIVFYFFPTKMSYGKDKVFPRRNDYDNLFLANMKILHER